MSDKVSIDDPNYDPVRHNLQMSDLDRCLLLVCRLNDEQREKVMETARRCGKPAPVLSTRTKMWIAVYLLGCAILYFGIPQSLLELWRTHQWKYMPEQDVFGSLGNAAVELIRPFLAAVTVGWMVSMPLVLLLGLWGCVEDFLRFLRRGLERLRHNKS